LGAPPGQNGSIHGLMPYFIRRPLPLPSSAPLPLDPAWLVFLDAAPVMIWISDATGRFRFVNAEWKTATGLGTDAIPPETIQELVHPDDREKLAANESLFAGKSDCFAYRLRFADGGYRWVQERIQPWRDADGCLLGYIGSVMAVGAQSEHEQQLTLIALRQLSLTKFSRMVLEERSLEEISREAVRLFREDLTLPAAVLLLKTDDDLPMQVVAAQQVKITDLPPPRLQASPTSFVLDLPEDAADFPLEASRLEELGWAGGFAVPVDRNDPQAGFLVGLRHTPQDLPPAELEHTRNLAGLLAIARARHQAHQGLAESEARALQTQKMEAVGLLAGGIAHDFNNLLTAISCFAELLRDELTVKTQLAKLDDILHASSRASHLVRQLLAFSRQEISRPEDTDLNLLVDELRGFIRSLLSEHVRITVDLDDQPAWFRADRKQVEQIIFNLCLNARDAMPADGTLTLRVRNLTVTAPAASGPPPGRYVRLTVADTGVGIPAAVQARLFQPFFSTKSKGRGTGLGLATCLNIAHANGGTISFESEVGRGTAFHIYFPEAAPQARPSDLPDCAVPARGHGRILLVEDDDLVRSVTILLAKSIGYEVMCFGSSLEALEYARGTQLAGIDLLLTDVIMPEINGQNLARQLLEIKPGLPILYMSGYVDDPITQHTIAQDGVHFLAKPFSAEEFATKLSQVMNPKLAAAQV
jgi:two-component system cell cycle sensor histidine kinase/response regulator CckA